MAHAAAEVQAQLHIHSVERLLDHLESRRQHHRQLQEGAAAGRQDALQAPGQPSGAAQVLIADDSQALLNAAQAAVSVLHSAGDCQQLWALCRAVLVSASWRLKTCAGSAGWAQTPSSGHMHSAGGVLGAAALAAGHTPATRQGRRQGKL